MHQRLVNISTNCEIAVQSEARGTGDAVRSGLSKLEDFSGSVLILSGDVPLIKLKTLQDFIRAHNESKSTVSAISAKLTNPANYGRVVRDRESGEFTSIVERKDCSQTQALIDEINSGIYLVDSAFLLPAIKKLDTDNAQGEFYLTDIVSQAYNEGQRTLAWICSDPSELFGANTANELAELRQIIRRRKVEELVSDGVCCRGSR